MYATTGGSGGIPPNPSLETGWRYRWNPTDPSLVTRRDEERNIKTWGLKFTEGQSYR